MRHPENLPDKETAGYQLLELVAISGELPADQLRRLPGGDAYKLNVCWGKIALPFRYATLPQFLMYVK